MSSYSILEAIEVENLPLLLQNPVLDWLSVFFYIGVTVLIAWRVFSTEKE